MKKFGVLKTVVVLQAVCMIVLGIVVVIKLSPLSDHTDPAGDTFLDSGDDSPDGDQTTEQSDNKDIAATIGGLSIMVSDLEQQLNEQYGDAVLRTMMLHTAIDLEAKAQQLEVSVDEQERELAAMIEGYESEEAFYKVMKEQLGMSEDDVREEMKYRLLLEKIAILKVNVSDEEVSDYIAENPEQFADRIQFHLQWIVTKTADRAEEVLDLLSAGEDFDQVAKVYSSDTFTADTGGDLGLIDSDDPFYDTEMLDTASRLQTGEMAGPIEVDDGYAIIRLVERHKTSGMIGHRLDDMARKQLALSRSKPLNEIEDELLTKYNAVVVGE